MELNDHRLDSISYLSGALEARMILEQLEVEKQPLKEITQGGSTGIFNGPRFPRHYVDNPNHGIPFLGSTDILAADLFNLSFLSNKQVKAKPELLIDEGWTLISCSGTIGRMAYARSDMKGMAGSQHFMRVVPDPQKIKPGYLYAFLSSKFGVPLVVEGTYGAIIQHIEPKHLTNLPIPRLGDDTEIETDKLINRAAKLRVSAAKTLQESRRKFGWLWPEVFDNISLMEGPKTNTVCASQIHSRLDAAYYNPLADQVEKRIRSGHHTTIGQICQRVFLPGIFKRIYVDNEEYGAPYYTGSTLYWLEPIHKGILSRKSSLFEDVFLEKGTILVQAFGQIGGLIGRPTWVGKHLDGATTTHMLVRLNLHDPDLAGYLFAFLDSPAGYTLLTRLPYGGSIPHFDEAGIANVPIPLMDEEGMRAISQKVLSAFDARDEALDCELEARTIIESIIEKYSM